MEGAPTELWRFACEGFLGNLTREHQARLARVEAELEATVDGETIPYRMLRVAMSNEPDRDKRRAARGDARPAARRAPEPGLPRRRADRPRGRRSSSASPNYYELYKRFGFRLDELADECRDAARRDREALGARGRPPLPLAARDRARRRAAVGRRRGSSARPSSTSSTRRTACCPRSRRRSTDLGIDLRSQENVHLDLETRPSKTPRAFCAPIEVPGQGDARHPADRRQGRLGGALPRGRPHRALRAHERPTCRWRRSASATWRSPRAGRC